jgi:zona occludens toxin
MGTKPPAEIAALETHRHRGVDFVLITQHPMLIDQNVRRLIGRHEHVRRIFGMQRALVYQWDGCQSDVSRLGSGTRTIFTYPKKAFELYKSSELHTKPQFKIPAFFLFPLVVVGLAIVAGPTAYSALKGAATGKGLPGEKAAARPLPDVTTAAGKAGEDRGSAAAAPALPAAVVEKAHMPNVGAEFMGCIAMGNRCSCFDLSGRLVEVEAEACKKAVQTVARVIPGEAQPLAGSGGRSGQPEEAGSQGPGEPGIAKGASETPMERASDEPRTANPSPRVASPGARQGQGVSTASAMGTAGGQSVVR